ncbi:hypothetical protein HYALB_00007882 [Hymenoscyphus albidus]|uniref:Mannosyltransferase n=1 Tax=Hymenoscyphus albidus TaxID=595503 RepID=A0A9N9LI90_9HELO|nr:hypothetical protein HYALB_00007882 [Hymenoscyphus albidus]
MQPIDAILYTLIPTLILLHLVLAPYTKVEESFNIQATHDILTYSLPPTNLSSSLASYDHVFFPGAVPRTFIGALALAVSSKPFILLFGSWYSQGTARAVLGMFNTACLIRYKRGLDGAFGEGVGRWWVGLVVSGFHVNYYASRTLPNMFAFGLTTLASCNFLPLPAPNKDLERKRQIKGISLLVFSAVVFRSEIALLLFTQLIASLIQSRITPQTIILTGLASGIVSIALTVAIDSFFWQKPLWPELWGFYFNVFEGKSSEWGTSPYGYYFVNLLPKLLLNPLIQFLLIPTGVVIPALKFRVLEMVIPALAFVAIYSLQPHKEARFVIYVVPQLVGAAALSADWIWKRRGKDLKYGLGSFLIVVSILGCFAASTGMLLISSLNYPGGAAINTFHRVLYKDIRSGLNMEEVKVHMDVLSCMTGVTRFQEVPREGMVVNGKPTKVLYDKTEDPDTLLTPTFWEGLDYALMESPEKAIGKWEIVETIFAYAGIEFLKPGDGTSFGEHLERVYIANNISVVHEGKKQAPDGDEVRDTLRDLEEGGKEGTKSVEERRLRVRAQEMNRFGTFNLLRDGARGVTGGWWVGPRMEPSVKVLRRTRE